MSLTIAAYQQAARRTDKNPPPSRKGLTIALLGLASEAADLLAEFKKMLRDGQSYERFQLQARTELGDVLWYAATTASHLGFELEGAARQNLLKTKVRFGLKGARHGTQTSLVGRYDSAFPSAERLPRVLMAHFVPTSGHRPTVSIIVNGHKFGDPLNDNSHTDDGYRFHDALHLGFAACLGWSPLVRKLLNRKRKSVPEFDENEDGARARILEEALAALVHRYASDREDLRDLTSIDTDFLTTLTQLVGALEIGDARPSDWERTILRSYAAFRSLRDAGGGWIRADLDRRTIEFVGSNATRSSRTSRTGDRIRRRKRRP